MITSLILNSTFYYDISGEANTPSALFTLPSHETQAHDLVTQPLNTTLPTEAQPPARASKYRQNKHNAEQRDTKRQIN